MKLAKAGEEIDMIIDVEADELIMDIPLTPISWWWMFANQ